MAVWKNPPIHFKSQVYSAQELGETIDWGQRLVGLPEAWQQETGDNIRCCVVDTGCDIRHKDLVNAVADAQDFTQSRFGVEDRDGHGTHVASNIGATADGQGIRGPAQCKLYIAKALGDDGFGSDESVAKSIEWGLRMNCDLFSMSLGSPFPSERIRQAIEDAVDAGAFVICAAGNDGDPRRPRQGNVNYPARWDDTLAVSAVGRNGEIAPYSSRGPEVDIAAPGSDILGCAPGGGYVRMSGTSMATPLVSGIVALILAVHKRLGERSQTPITTVEHLREHLARTAIDVGLRGRDQLYGWGLIQATLPDIDDNPQPPPDDDKHDENDGDEIRLCGGLRLFVPRGFKLETALRRLTK